MSIRSARRTRRVSSPLSPRFSWPQHPWLEAEHQDARRSSTLSALSAALLASAVLMPGISPALADVSNGADGSLRAVAPENSGPSVQIMQPGYNDQIKATQQILVAVGTRRFAPQSIELFVDGKSATKNGPIPLAASMLPSAVFNWDTANAADGPHKLTVRVTDVQGFIGQAEVQVYVNNSKVRDLTPPSLAWLNPPSSALKGVVKLQLRAQDKFGVKFVVVSLNPAANPDVKPPLRSWFANVPPYAVPLDTRALPDGLYVLKAIGTDAMGNEGEAQSLQVGVNNSGSGLDPFILPRDSGTTMLPKFVPMPTKPAPSRVAPSTTAPVKVPAKPAAAQPPARVAAVLAPQTPDVPPQVSLTTGGRNGAIGSVLTQPIAERAASRSPVAPRTSNPRLASRPTLEAGNTPVAAPEAPAEAAMTTMRPVPSAPRQVNPAVVKPAVPNRFALSRPAPPHLTPRGDASDAAPEVPAPVVGMAQADGSASQPRAATSVRPHAAIVNPQFRVAAVPQNPRPNAAPIDASAPAQLTPLQAPPRSRPGAQAALPAPSAASQPAPRAGVPQAMTPQAARPDTRLSMLPPADVLAPRSPESSMITVAPFVNDSHPLSHVAREGETISQIAARYNLPPHVLATVNHRSLTAHFKKGEVVKLAQPLTVSYGGQAVQSDVDSLMIGSTGVTPFRFLFEKQGGKLEWDGKNQRVIAHDGQHEITLTIGSNVAMVNKKEVAMDLAAFLMSGRTMVPLRFFEKALHAQVEWNPSTGGLYVAMAN